LTILRRIASFHPGSPGFGSFVEFELAGPSVDVEPARTLRIRSRRFNASMAENISEQVFSKDSIREASKFSFRACDEVLALAARTSAKAANKMAKAINA
jgi:hypothetical protein